MNPLKAIRAKCSDDALVEELARAISIADRKQIPDGLANGWPDDLSDWDIHMARAILPIIHAREAAAKADAERLIEAERDHGKLLAVTAYDSGHASGLAEGRKQALEDVVLYFHTHLAHKMTENDCKAIRALQEPKV